MTETWNIAIKVLQNHLDFLENNEDLHNNLDLYAGLSADSYDRRAQTQTGEEILAEDIANLIHAIDLLKKED